MKYSVLAFALSFMFVACGNSNSEHNDEASNDVVEMEAPVAENAVTDPVCGMVYDAAWTDYSVSGTDTLWFCGEGCKKAYEARPEKYMKKEG